MSNAERLGAALTGVLADAENRVDEDVIGAMVDRLRDLVDDEVVVEMVGAEGFATEHHGIDGLREAWGDWLEAFAEVRFNVEEVREVGENVLSVSTQVGITRHGGVEIEQPSAAVFKFRGDRIRRVEFHLDQQAAERSAREPA